MGISASEFWARSTNGKAMLIMLARRGDTELVRDICEWLVVKHRNDIEASAVANGATKKQAEVVAQNNTAAVMSAAESISDRNCEGMAGQVVDVVFQRHYNHGQQTYAKAMAWFAGELRGRVKQLPGERD